MGFYQMVEAKKAILNVHSEAIIEQYRKANDRLWLESIEQLVSTRHI